MQTCGALIDDEEDGTGRICEGVEGRQGAWYAFNDDTGMQWPPKTSPGTPILTSLNAGRGDASRRAMHTFGSGFSKWGSGIGFDLSFDGSRYRTYDARAYAGIGFWMRSDKQQNVRVRVSSESSTAPAYGGTCAWASCAGPPGLVLQATPRWRYHQLSFDELARADSRLLLELDRLTNVQFMAERLAEFDYWVDDVSFLEAPPSCCPTSPACRDGVQFADPALGAAHSDFVPITALDCTSACTVRHLGADRLATQSLGGVECFTNLETVGAQQNHVRDLTPLAGLTHLTALDVSYNQVVEATALGKLTQLSSLVASHNFIERVELRGLTSLRVLDLSHNALEYAGSLTGARPWMVALNGNRLADISSLSGLTMGVACEDCSTPAGLLDLSSNLLTDLSPLLSMSLGLSVVDLRDNPFDCAAQSGVIQVLRASGAVIKTDCG